MPLKSSEPDRVTKNGLFYCCGIAAMQTQTTYYISELETGQIKMKIRIQGNDFVFFVRTFVSGGGEEEDLNKKESEKAKKETPDFLSRSRRRRSNRS